ncbi:hypothetical protein DEO72_LG4g2159 [Vigna unguiculata]|uniref:Uncharacterized protein n=1 Tax=Vigna unguiculata TaxID=3917 RepID=A0A4D6LRS4_VIGUN|nr:hypothetical protein DEO72_LG4g2159 [Vigna unguiculata]
MDNLTHHKNLKRCPTSFENALIGLLTAALGQASSKLSSSSLLISALGAVGPVGLRVEAEISSFPVARPVILAQATRSRLGETCREQTLARTRALAQARDARLSENAWELENLKRCPTSFENALIGLLTAALGQASSKLSSSSLLISALGAVGPVGLRVEAEISSFPATRSRLGETCREQTLARTRALAQVKGLSFERVRNSLESLGEVSGSCFSGRDIISWSLLLGVHGGAPSI